MAKRKGYVVWLVTWEWAGDHAKVDNKVAAILNPRWRPRKVAEYVEFIYAQSQYYYSEKLGLAAGKWSNPYPFKWGSIPPGVPSEEMITCGDNPYLYARKVNNLRVEENEDGTEKVLWDERPKPSNPILP